MTSKLPRRSMPSIRQNQTRCLICPLGDNKNLGSQRSERRRLTSVLEKLNPLIMTTLKETMVKRLILLIPWTMTQKANLVTEANNARRSLSSWTPKLRTWMRPASNRPIKSPCFPAWWTILKLAKTSTNATTSRKTLIWLQASSRLNYNRRKLLMTLLRALKQWKTQSSSWAKI